MAVMMKVLRLQSTIVLALMLLSWLLLLAVDDTTCCWWLMLWLWVLKLLLMWLLGGRSEEWGFRTGTEPIWVCKERSRWQIETKSPQLETNLALKIQEEVASSIIEERRKIIQIWQNRICCNQVEIDRLRDQFTCCWVEINRILLHALTNNSKQILHSNFFVKRTFRPFHLWSHTRLPSSHHNAQSPWSKISSQVYNKWWCWIRDMTLELFICFEEINKGICLC